MGGSLVGWLFEPNKFFLAPEKERLDICECIGGNFLTHTAPNWHPKVYFMIRSTTLKKKKKKIIRVQGEHGAFIGNTDEVCRWYHFPDTWLSWVPEWFCWDWWKNILLLLPGVLDENWGLITSPVFPTVQLPLPSFLHSQPWCDCHYIPAIERKTFENECLPMSLVRMLL